MNKVEEIKKDDQTKDNVITDNKEKDKEKSVAKKKTTSKTTNKTGAKASTKGATKTAGKTTDKTPSKVESKTVNKQTKKTATKTTTKATPKTGSKIKNKTVESEVADKQIKETTSKKATKETTKTTTKAASKTKAETTTKTSKTTSKEKGKTTTKKTKGNKTKEVSKLENNSIDELENTEIATAKADENKKVVTKLNEDITENEKEQEMLNQETGKKAHSKYKIVITTISVLLFIGLVVFSTIFGLTNRTSDKIVSGVSIKGIDVSGLTYNEAQEKISSIYNEKLEHSIYLKHNDYENNISPEEIEASFRIKEALDMAYSVGRSGKVLKDNYAIINAKLMKVDINPSITYNEKLLDEFINEISASLPDSLQQSSYSVDGDNLKIVKGQKGYAVNKSELITAILDNITNLNSKAEVLEIPVQEQEPEKIDIEKIYSEIHKQAKDAYYTKEPFRVYPHVDGVDFNISMEEAKALVNSNQDEVIIPLKITKPNITTNQIGTEAFPNLLASYSTTFSTSNVNRTTNIRLASNKINGVVVMPGEEFSYNKVVGQRTAAAGFKPAAAYSGGKVVNELGGGICQVSSTLYNTVLRSNLEIVKRSNHRFATGYVPLSTDATVSWGGPEFVFKNSRKYPIKIISTVTGGKIKVDIYGCKEDVEYEVIIQSETLQVIPMKTEYRTNTSLPEGTTKTVQKGHPGYKSRAYRILKLNGAVVSKQLLSTDTYAQLSTIIETN